MVNHSASSPSSANESGFNWAPFKRNYIPRHHAHSEMVTEQQHITSKQLHPLAHESRSGFRHSSDQVLSTSKENRLVIGYTLNIITCFAVFMLIFF